MEAVIQFSMMDLQMQILRPSNSKDLLLVAPMTLELSLEMLKDTQLQVHH